MERDDVVVLEVDLDERLPVVVALVDLDAVEHVAREVEVAHAEPREVARARRAARRTAGRSSSASGERPRFRHGLSGKCGAPRSSPLEVVGPAVDRADDVRRVAAALEHDRLPVAADVRDELDALRVAHERLRVVARLEREVVARLRAPSARARRSRARARTAAAARRRTPRDRNTRRREAATWRAANAPPWRDSTSACPFVRFPLKQPTQPNNPGRLRRYRPPRTALLSRPHEKLVKGRVAKS